MEGDYSGATSPPLYDGESYATTAPKLSALFAMEQQKLQSGDSSFRYHPPKVSAVQSTAAKGVTPVSGFAAHLPGAGESYSSAPSIQVLHSVAVLQLLISNSSGGKNLIGNAGMAILETSSLQTKSYQLVLYDSSKRTLATTSINEDFLCMPKADCWVNFITVHQSWSALFNSTENWVDFARAVVLARSLVARISDSFSDVVIQDISPQQDIPQAGLRGGDMVQVTYRAWIQTPGLLSTLVHSFQETSGKGKKLELGSGKAIKGLEQGVIGMTKSSRRLLVIPPHLGYGSSSERPDRVPDDAVLLFDVTVSRTRRHKGLASEAYGGKELLSDQLSFNGDAGLEREELTAPNFCSVNIHDDVKMVSASAIFKDNTEESGQEDKHLTNEKKELLIDRMAKLSRIGGAGSYNLPPSSVAAHHKRFNNETSQPSSPSSVTGTSERFTVETLQLSLDGSDDVRDPGNQDSIRVVGPDITDTLKSTSISPVAIEDNIDDFVKLTEEDELSESGNRLTERSEVADEIQLVSSPTVSHPVDCQHQKLGDAVADVANEHPGIMDNSLNSWTAAVAGQSKTSNSCCVPMSTGTSTPLSKPDALGPQFAKSTLPSPSPVLGPQWAQSSPFAYPLFPFPTTMGTLPPNSSEVPHPFSVLNASAQFQPMGPLPFVPTTHPVQGTHPILGQGTQPYLGHLPVVPWYPWGFPQYAPHSIPVAESKHENLQLKILQKIEQAQESFAESLRNLTIKVEALTEICRKRLDPFGNEQSSGHWSLSLGSGGKGSIFQDQVGSEDGDNQVDSLVESVALMLAENKELKRRLAEYKNQSPKGKQSSHRLMFNMEEDKWLEDPGSSSGVPQLNLERKTHPDQEGEPTTSSPGDSAGGEAEL